MTTISISELTTVSGGVTHGAPGSESAQYKEMCLTPNPTRAKQQYDWAVAREIPDEKETPGVKHRVVAPIGHLCHWDQK